MATTSTPSKKRQKKQSPKSAKPKIDPDDISDIDDLMDEESTSDIEDSSEPKSTAERYAPFVKRGYRWYANEGIDPSDPDRRRLKLRVITDFDLVINAVIERWNHDTSQWDRHIQCYMVFEGAQRGKPVSSDMFDLQPKECVSKRDLQVAVFRREFLDSYFKNDDEVKSFFVFLDELNKPRKVRQYGYFGFIDYGRERYFLAKNVLIHIPKANAGDRMWLMAPDEDGFFPLPPHLDPDGHTFLSLDPGLHAAPSFSLGPVINGVYQDDMDWLETYKPEVDGYKYADQLQEMVCGQRPELYDGRLVWAYMNAFNLYETITKTYEHGLFLYLYGEPSAGKGRLANIIMNYWGISSHAAEQVPTVRSIENLLERTSQVPVWLDEFKPDDFARLQYFNVWFEGKTRGTSSSADRKKNEVKNTRSWLFFCSNYTLRTDENHNHLRSRCMNVHMSARKRGKESALSYLEAHREQLQLHSIASMRFFSRLEPAFVSRELKQVKKLLKAYVSQRINSKAEATGNTYEITDREIQSMSILVTVDLLMSGMADTIRHYFDNFEGEESSRLHDELCGNSGLFRYGVDFLVESARVTSERDPVSQFLTWCELANDQGLIKEGMHYSWEEDKSGQISLRVALAKIIKIHEKDAGPRAIDRGIITNEFEARDPRKESRTLYISDASKMNPTYSRGYEIPESRLDLRYALAFRNPNIGAKIKRMDALAKRQEASAEAV